MRSDKSRLDLLLVERGLAESRQKARALILAGKVSVSGAKVTKAGALVPADAPLEVEAGDRYVSRGGLKLEGALLDLGVDPSEKVCLDVGASTGGFTDCLLQHGAIKVYAVDVGYGQLAWRLRQDPRVVVMERTNARYLESLPDPIDLCTVDASFISIRLLLGAIQRLLAPEGQVLAMVKPQFEVGKGRVGKGGVVRDDSLRREAADRVAAAAAELGLVEVGRADARLHGPKGNREIFLHLVARRRAHGHSGAGL